MNIEDVASELLAKRAVYQYVGNFLKIATDSVITDVDALLAKGNFSNASSKKLFNVTVEVVQNLHKYLKDLDPESEYSNGLFLINEVPEGVLITSGNYLLNTEIRSLENRIDLVNSLTNDEIAQFYRGLLDIGTMTRQGGAGLGFVDIAKKTGSKIQYQFKPINDRYSFYIFKILITK